VTHQIGVKTNFFKMHRKWSQKIKTVIDAAERGIILISDYNSILTTNEEQKQFVLQVVMITEKYFLTVKRKQ